MPLPEPHPGLVIHYSYLWAREHSSGGEEGRKNRPCAIVLARQVTPEVTVVTVVPVTHSPPVTPADAIEIPAQVKHHLGLDHAKSWAVLTEVNQFIWPGPDLTMIPGTSRYHFGVLPPGFFNELRDRLIRNIRNRRHRAVQRTQ